MFAKLWKLPTNNGKNIILSDSKKKVSSEKDVDTNTCTVFVIILCHDTNSKFWDALDFM